MISMNELGALAAALVEADREVEAAEDVLKRKKEYARTLREETLPSAMQELGLADVKLDTGQRIVVKQEVYASVPADKKFEAYDWLEQHGFGGLIKTSVAVMFGKGEMEEAQSLMLTLQEDGLAPDLERSVHAQTLKAFLKEQLSTGAEIPLDLFGARPVWTASVKR